MAEILTNRTFIHYGSSVLDKGRFPIKNSCILGKKVASKKPNPSTGLWASPIDTPKGWKQDREKVGKALGTESFMFELKDNAKVLVINDCEDINSLKLMQSEFVCGFDFEDAAKKYDAIFLSEAGLESQNGLSFSHDNDGVLYYQRQKNLYGWDCVTLLVLNPDCILVDEVE